MRRTTRANFPSGRAIWAFVVFLCGFGVILPVVAYLYLFPAMRAAAGADPIAQRQLAAVSAMVLAVVLVSLLAMLIITLRPGRFQFPRKTSGRTRTTYVDAWAESARRMEKPKKPED
jgi:hypothetical protein